MRRLRRASSNNRSKSEAVTRLKNTDFFLIFYSPLAFRRVGCKKNYKNPYSEPQ